MNGVFGVFNLDLPTFKMGDGRTTDSTPLLCERFVGGHSPPCPSVVRRSGPGPGPGGPRVLVEGPTPRGRDPGGSRGAREDGVQGRRRGRTRRVGTYPR